MTQAVCAGYPTNIYVLDMRFNSITSISVNAFNANLTLLTTLYLNNNRLTAFYVGSFNGLPALQYLYMSNNYVTTIPANPFVGLTSIYALDLSVNSITYITPFAFNGIGLLNNIYLQGNPPMKLLSSSFIGLSDGTTVICGTAASSQLCAVDDCRNTCASNSYCSGSFASPPSYTCSCLPGLISPTGNGKNCINQCTAGTCGPNSFCQSSGSCWCNQGYYSPTTDGINCAVNPPLGLIIC